MVEGRVTVVEPEGRIDSSSVSAMDEAFRQVFATDTRTLLVDMGKIEYISSGGLRSFLLAFKEMKKRDGKMVLTSMTPNVSKVFKLSGFNTIFDIVPSRQDGMSKLSVEHP